MKDVTQSSQDWEDFWYNSPTNSPYIVMTKQLTDGQLNELIGQYVEIVVENMDTESLVEYAKYKLSEYYEKLSDSELKEAVDEYDEELYEELVDNVTYVAEYDAASYT